jgi:microsomal dipeptidase-like Zn-dependent dipeptidase
MTTWADLPGLTAELLRRGYAEADLRKIYQENVFRVISAVLGA